MKYFCPTLEDYIAKAKSDIEAHQRNGSWGSLFNAIQTVNALVDVFLKGMNSKVGNAHKSNRDNQEKGLRRIENKLAEDGPDCLTDFECLVLVRSNCNILKHDRSKIGTVIVERPGTQLPMPMRAKFSHTALIVEGRSGEIGEFAWVKLLGRALQHVESCIAHN
ncbi:hypothetical protein [Thalassospira povalilytica]|uniref:hypothetical protein n=1 Tax=Thalassospira povalilytica TaxID=732237 RepID=UPI003AA7C1C3